MEFVDKFSFETQNPRAGNSILSVSAGLSQGGVALVGCCRHQLSEHFQPESKPGRMGQLLFKKSIQHHYKLGVPWSYELPLLGKFGGYKFT